MLHTFLHFPHLDFQGKHDDADSLHLRAFAILERVFGVDHSNVAGSLANRATLLHVQVEAHSEWYDLRVTRLCAYIKAQLFRIRYGAVCL